MQQTGPRTRITYHCDGCIFLELKDWEFYGENDEIDRGTDAHCTKVDKHIGRYYYKGNRTPDWCPFMGNL